LQRGAEAIHRAVRRRHEFAQFGKGVHGGADRGKDFADTLRKGCGGSNAFLAKRVGGDNHLAQHVLQRGAEGVDRLVRGCNHRAQVAQRFDGRANHGQDFADRIRKALRAAYRLHAE